MYWIYILKSQNDGSFYVGSTGNLDDRLRRHFEGRSKFTKKKLPLSLIYKEMLDTRPKAILREKYIKSMKSVKYIESLIEG